MSGLEVRHLGVTHPGTPPIEAVRDVSLSVAPGEVVGLLGPSGCGKSSLLAAIVGIVPCTGIVLWDGEEITHAPVHLRGFGLVFQEGNLFPHLTVGGNVAFGLDMAGMAVPERAARVTDLLALVGLPGFENRPVDELSGGERQRVALARSLAPRPRLLLLDEPLSSLDSDLRGRLAVDVRDILHATGTTAVVVTHDRSEAQVMCSRVLHMEEGRLVGRRHKPTLLGGNSLVAQGTCRP